MIENLSHGFVHPNILDVKLGTVLHEPSATEEKKARMEKQARETTTRETGIRLTGFQVSRLRVCPWAPIVSNHDMLLQLIW